MPPHPPVAKPRPIEVAILGNDALMAALPARPVQLQHAVLASGFDFVVPVSWGEELLAEQVLRLLPGWTARAAIVCACPDVRDRLLATGSELAPLIVSFVSPAVATARYLRALHRSSSLRITFIGACDTQRDAAIDARVLPSEFLHQLAERGISPIRQPAVFESIIPPDRRRHYSVPGGAPSADALTVRAPEWRRETIDDPSFSTALADLLISGERVLIDLAPRLACASCNNCGDTPSRSSETSERFAELEPPRAPAPVIDHDVAVVIEAPVSRRPDRRPRGSDTGRTAPGTAPDHRASAPAADRVTVHPIEPARRRAELRRIAITPASVPITADHDARPALAEPQVATGGLTPSVAPVSRSALEGGRRSVPAAPSQPAPVAAPAATPPTAPAPQLEHRPSGEPTTTPRAPSAATRRRTPVHETFQVARLAAQARAAGGRRGFVSVARAFAVHRRALAGMRATPAPAVIPLPETDAPPLTPEAAIRAPNVPPGLRAPPPASPLPDVATTLRRQARHSVRGDPRRVPPPVPGTRALVVIATVATVVAVLVAIAMVVIGTNGVR